MPGLCGGATQTTPIGGGSEHDRRRTEAASGRRRPYSVVEARAAGAAVRRLAAPRGESNPQAPLLKSSKPQRRKFVVEPFDAIKFDSCEEWLVKRIIPRQGVGALYGASQSLKSFVAFHLALQVALGWELAGRRVRQAPAIYVAAEGAAGLRKRKVGFERANAGRLPGKIPFFLSRPRRTSGPSKAILHR